MSEHSDRDPAENSSANLLGGLSSAISSAIGGGSGRHDGGSLDASRHSREGREGIISRNMPRRRYLLLEDVAEDLDEEELSVHMAGGGRLQDDELLSFVNVYSPSEFMSHDAHHVAHPTHPELNRTGSQLVWVENAHTGELVPVARRGKKKMSLRMGRGGGRGQETADVDAEAGGDLEAGALESDRLLGTPSMPPPLDVGEMGVGAFQKSLHQQQEDEIAPIVSYRNLVMVQRACFLVVQGMLAGFCFTTLLAVESANGSDTQLLLFYQPTAQDYRRFFYLLSSTSLLGAIDLCLTVYSSKWDSGHIAQQTGSYAYQRALVALRMEYDFSALLLALSIAALYAVVFATVLLMSAFDVLASVRNGLPATDSWPALALADPAFSASLSEWKALNNLRVICSVSAWLGSCLFVWKDLTQLNSKSADLFRLRETTVAWSSRAAQMGGAGIEKLRPGALRKLVAVLKVGSERAKDALSFYEQEAEETSAL